MRILKLQLNIHGVNEELVLPGDSRVLSLQMQNGIPTLWYVHGNAPDKILRIECYPTGTTIPDSANLLHIGTVQTPKYVYHYFVRISF